MPQNSLIGKRWSKLLPGSTYQATSIIYSSVPLVGKVIECEQTEYQTAAATALVYGYGSWNDANFLPFEITFRPFNTSLSYNVTFTAGSFNWLRALDSGISSGVAGITIWGTLSSVNSTEITYQNTNIDVSAYIATDTSRYIVTTIGILASCTEDQLKSSGAHEWGHALGWAGHSNDTNTLMHFTANNLTNTEVTNKDSRHISQIYDLLY